MFIQGHDFIFLHRNWCWIEIRDHHSLQTKVEDHAAVALPASASQGSLTERLSAGHQHEVCRTAGDGGQVGDASDRPRGHSGCRSAEFSMRGGSNGRFLARRPPDPSTQCRHRPGLIERAEANVRPVDLGSERCGPQISRSPMRGRLSGSGQSKSFEGKKSPPENEGLPFKLRPSSALHSPSCRSLCMPFKSSAGGGRWLSNPGTTETRPAAQQRLASWSPHVCSLR